LLAEHQRWSKVSEATTIRSSDSTGMSAIGDRSSHLSALDSNVQASFATIVAATINFAMMNKKLQSKGFEEHQDKRLWNSRTSGNRSVVHDTVNNIRRKSSSYIR
ncbi:hypothetical protein Tco_1398550, partial [Tanacetum coccineum]